MAIKRENLAKELLIMRSLSPVPYSSIDSDGLWLFPIRFFFSVDGKSGVIVGNDGAEIKAEVAVWDSGMTRKQQWACVYVCGKSRKFFIGLSDEEIFQTIVEDEFTKHHSFYT